MRYVALLRGVNAGGKRRVPMSELRQIFDDMGFSDVATYINSGNVIFSSDQTPDATVIQDRLEAYFGFDIETLVLSQQGLERIVQAIPDTWQNDYREHKSDVCFLLPDIDSPDILDQIRPNREIETVRYVPGGILSNISRKNQPKSSLVRLVGTPLYHRMTIRNVTTARKLAELVASRDG